MPPPPIPPGFELEGASQSAPPIPPGFELEQPKAAAAPSGGFAGIFKGEGIPLPGGGTFRPSLIEAAKGLFSGATLPRDVYQGKVDPLSEEGIRRSADLAMMVQMPRGSPTLATKAAEALPPTAAELKATARPTFKELTEAGNTIAVPGEDIANSLVADLHPQNFRQVNAGRTYRDINRLSSAKDLNDVANIRDKLRDTANGISENKLIKVGGEDAIAAGLAKDALDQQIDQLSPGWVDKMKTADANWAAAMRMNKVNKEAAKGAKGRLGSFDANETRAKGFTPEELEAIKKAHVGGNAGILFNNIGAHTNLFHGGLEGMLGGPLNLSAKILTTLPVGIPADMIAKGLRQRALNQALARIASRSPLAQDLAQMQSAGIVQLPTLNAPAAGLLPFRRQDTP